MDIKNYVKFYDEDDLYKLQLDNPLTTKCLINLASYETDSFKIGKMNDLLEYVDGNGFNITYDKASKKYIIKRGQVR